MSLTTMLGIGPRELISLVGGGGKSTMLFALGDELAAAGNRVLLTTTTKMGRAQTTRAAQVCWSAEPGQLATILNGPGPVMVVTGGDGHKVTGPGPAEIDRLFAEGICDHFVIEADGSRGKPLKAPGAHEPVVPTKSTHMVIMVGIDAVGRPLENVAHRVEQAQRFSGLGPDDRLSVADCADILLHADGALRVAPAQATITVAITHVANMENQLAASELAAIIEMRRPDIAAIVIPPSQPAP